MPTLCTPCSLFQPEEKGLQSECGQHTDFLCFASGLPGPENTRSRELSDATASAMMYIPPTQDVATPPRTIPTNQARVADQSLIPNSTQPQIATTPLASGSPASMAVDDDKETVLNRKEESKSTIHKHAPMTSRRLEETLHEPAYLKSRRLGETLYQPAPMTSCRLEETLPLWTDWGKKLSLVPLSGSRSIRCIEFDRQKLKRMYTATPVIFKHTIFVCGWGRRRPCEKLFAIEIVDGSGNAITTRKANVPGPRRHYGIAIYNHFIYMLGGVEATKAATRCDVYDINADEWRPLPPLTHGRDLTAACVVNQSQLLVYSAGCRSKSKSKPGVDCIFEQRALSNTSTPWTTQTAVGYIPTLTAARSLFMAQVGIDQVLIFADGIGALCLALTTYTMRVCKTSPRNNYEMGLGVGNLSAGQYRLVDVKTNIFCYNARRETWTAPLHCQQQSDQLTHPL